jgi:hypothetical protein
VVVRATSKILGHRVGSSVNGFVSMRLDINGGRCLVDLARNMSLVELVWKAANCFLETLEGRARARTTILIQPHPNFKHAVTARI